MLLVVFISLFCLANFCNGRILVYDTELNISSSEKMDCIYILDNVNTAYGGSSAGKVPYCRRLNITKTFARISDKCENGGQMKYFIDLFKENIRPFEVLEWNSSVEMADKYGAFYHNNYLMLKLNEKQDFLCHCTHPSTFGRYCEYKLTHEANSFEDAQRLQASNRSSSTAAYHQEFGDIVCYKTLSCNSGLLCLDWRNICDGQQQCENGWDEENCDLIEFNECEKDEYRCHNGMCIPEEYWLDGKYICLINKQNCDEKYFL
jgi:hypothetical protein